MQLPHTKQTAHLLGILLLMTCLLAACSTTNVGHLPRQAISGQSAQTFQMQYMILHVSNAQSELSEQRAKPRYISKQAPEKLQLTITVQIRTENLPSWVTQLELANLVIYLVNDENTVIATHSTPLPEQDLSAQTQMSLNVQITLPDGLDSATLAFGYHLPVRNTEKTRRIVLTEMAVNTK